MRQEFWFRTLILFPLYTYIIWSLLSENTFLVDLIKKDLKVCGVYSGEHFPFHYWESSSGAERCVALGKTSEWGRWNGVWFSPSDWLGLQNEATVTEQDLASWGKAIPRVGTVPLEASASTGPLSSPFHSQQRPKGTMETLVVVWQAAYSFPSLSEALWG